MQDYHGIRAWKKAHALAINIHRLTKRFPRTGYASLKDQMMRSAESIEFTIVEGSAAATPKEFARFLDMSIKSASELEAQLKTGTDYGIVPDRDWRSYTDEVRDIRKMTWGLRQKVLGKEAPETKKLSDANGPVEVHQSRKTDHGQRKTDNASTED